MMVVGKEDLGLTLSLSCSNNTTNTPNTSHHGNNRNMNMNSNGNNNNNNNQMGFLMMMNKNTPQTTPFSPTNSSTPLQLNLMMNPTINISSNSTPPITTTTPATTGNSFLHKLQRHPSTDSFPPSDRLFLRGIDVNRPSVGGGGGGEEDDAGVSSPNSTVSTVSGKRSRDSATAAGGGAGDEIDTERTSSRGGMSDDEDGGENSRKKLRLTKDQSATLEETFKEHNTLNPKQKLALAKRLGLRPRQVEVWFQNRRARTKLKQTEVDCEFLKRCCEQLTEENRRLQKEVQELRTLKMSPQFYMQMTPPTTLTMCPSCERVAVPPGGGGGPDSRRPLPVNPWAVKAPTPIRSFDGVNTRTLV